jgi:hypothetical protein
MKLIAFHIRQSEDGFISRARFERVKEFDKRFFSLTEDAVVRKSLADALLRIN